MGESHEVLLNDKTLFITPEMRVTLAWHSKQMTLELITWKPIIAGDLKGNFEKVGTVTLTGPNIKKFIKDIVSQENAKVRPVA